MKTSSWSRCWTTDRERRPAEIVGEPIKVLDVVALTEDLPDRGLRRGQVGTVVEILSQDVFEIEFSDTDGQAYARLALRHAQLPPSQYRPWRTAG